MSFQPMKIKQMKLTVSTGIVFKSENSKNSTTVSDLDLFTLVAGV